MGNFWIEWSGGPCPLPDNAMVMVKFRDGSITKGFSVSQMFVWEHKNGRRDIIAYHSAKWTEAPTALNEPGFIIETAFLEGYLNALPDGWAKDEHSTTRILGDAIAKGMAAAIKVWERR